MKRNNGMNSSLKSWLTVAALAVVTAVNCHVTAVSLFGSVDALVGPLKFATVRLGAVGMLAIYVVIGFSRMRSGLPALLDDER